MRLRRAPSPPESFWSAEPERPRAWAWAWAWVAVALIHTVAGTVVTLVERWHHVLDWESAAAAMQPWRVFTAAWVHWSTPHLTANLLGAAALAVLGWSMRLPWAAACAWLLAWPAGQAALALVPSPMHVGGLSGVLHAGAAVAAVALWIDRRGAARTMGASLAAVLVVALAWQWLRGPRPMADSVALTVPAIHLTSSLCGAAFAWAVGVGRRSRVRSARH